MSLGRDLKNDYAYELNNEKEKNMEVIPTGNKSGVKLEEYKGTYSLTAQSENDGKFWGVWAKYKKGKNGYMDKDWPIKVTLGDKDTAIGVLQTLIKDIGGEPF